MKRIIIILLSLIVLCAMPVLAKPMIMVTCQNLDEEFMLDELSDEEIAIIKGQQLLSFEGFKHIGNEIWIFKGFSEFEKIAINKAKISQLIKDYLLNLKPGTYSIDLFVDPQTGETIFVITPIKS